MSEIKDVTIDDIVKRMKQNNKKADTKIIIRAYEYAKSHHGDQLRKSGEPYIIHPIQVAYILATLELDERRIRSRNIRRYASRTRIFTRQ